MWFRFDDWISVDLFILYLLFFDNLFHLDAACHKSEEKICHYFRYIACVTHMSLSLNNSQVWNEVVKARGESSLWFAGTPPESRWAEVENLYWSA